MVDAIVHRTGTRRSRHQRQDSQGSHRELQDPPHHALPHGRVWAAADRLAQPEGCGRMGDQGNGVVGLRQRPSRAVGFRPSGLGERTGCRGRPHPVSRQARIRSARVDAEHRRHGEGKGLQHGPADAADQGRTREVPRERQGQRQGRHRPCRQVDAGAGEPRAASQANAGRCGARAIQRDACGRRA